MSTDSQKMAQYMALKKSKLGPFLVSFLCCPGAGLLMVDSGKYMGKFIISFLTSWLLIGWILGIVWTLGAVDEKNQILALQFEVPAV